MSCFSVCMKKTQAGSYSGVTQDIKSKQKQLEAVVHLILGNMYQVLSTLDRQSIKYFVVKL